MAFLVRVALSRLSEDEEKELQKAKEALADRKPEWFRAMREMGRAELRGLASAQGLHIAALDEAAGGRAFGVEFPTDLLAVPTRYAAKIGKALYYRHAGRIVPSGGLVRAVSWPNVTFMSPTFPLAQFDLLTERPVLARSGKDLQDQFAYRYAVARDGPGAAFLLQFRESVAMAVLVFEDAAEHALRKAVMQAEREQERLLEQAESAGLPIDVAAP